jgi:hypothetical protein
MTAAWDFNEDESGSDSDDSDDEFELRVDTDGKDLNDEVDLCAASVMTMRMSFPGRIREKASDCVLKLKRERVA